MTNTVTINEKEYQVKFSFNTLAEFENEYGKPLAESANDTRISTILMLFKYSLRLNHPKLTTKQVGDLLTQYTEEGGSITDLFSMIGDATTKLMGGNTPSKE